MKKVLLPIFSIIFIEFCSAQSPSVLWRFHTHDQSFGNAAMGYLTSDSIPEIVFSCYWGDSNIYVVHAHDGSLVWKANMGGCNDAAPIIYDVDHDGHPEVILASSCNPVLTCFNGQTGAIKWQQPFGGSDSPPSVADIDGDSIPEILVGDFEGNLNCFNALNGHLKWQVPVDDSAAIEASPALVDVNNDGHPDIIVCTWSFGGLGDSSAVYAYDGLTHSLIWKNHSTQDKVYHGAAFADLYEDGRTQLAVSSYDGHVYCLSADSGRQLWEYPAPSLAYVPDPVAIGDLDHDGHLDLVYISGYGEVDALDRYGSLKWYFNLDLYESSFRGAALADVNNDDTLDVVFATSEGRLIALNGSRGNLLWQIDLRSDYGDSLFGLEHGPVIAPFKGDDTLDVFVVGGYSNSDSLPGDFGRAYALKIGPGKGPNWTMYQHDEARSNCVCNGTSPTAIPNNTLSPFFINEGPNPFSDQVLFNIGLSQREVICVIVFDERGLPVKTFSNGIQESGLHTFIWNGTSDGGNDLANGIYTCQITAGHNSAVRKVVLMR